jgi:tetratricopeptide (TPR) repeat protein
MIKINSSCRWFWIVLCLILNMALDNLQAQTSDLQKALRASYLAEAKGDYGAAAKSLLEMLIREPQNYFLQMRAGYLNLMLGQYNASLNAYEIAAEMQPRAVEPAMGALKAAVGLGNWAVAEKWASNVLQQDPNNYVGLSRLAYSYFVRKDYAKASEQYQKVLMLYPSDTEMKSGLAWSYYYLGNKTKAQTLFTEVLAVNPDDAIAKQGVSASRK